MNKSLIGKTALITGAGRGVGRAIALKFAEAGADLVLIARSKDELSSTAIECAANGVKVVAETVDLAEIPQIESLLTLLPPVASSSISSSTTRRFSSREFWKSTPLRTSEKCLLLMSSPRSFSVRRQFP
ncbi:MAG: SDR family NAD(P)-dependent oxidoreductase [bacterium]|nr:SDR family NAD(P)-dependent oxidoreductase [bacterium]